ncbi:terminal uridylyltransferase 7 [Rhinophrynus dorsalis]
MDEEEYKKSNIKQSHISHEGHGGKKLDRDLQYKKAIPVRYSSSPRNGSQQSTLKNFCHSPSGRTGSNQKEGFKRWTADDQRSNSENWRERKSQQFSRLRNDSFHETDDVSRWHEGGERSNHNGRRMIQKGHASEGFPIIHSGGSESLVKQRKERSRCQSERDEEDYVESPVIDETMLSKRELLGLQQAEERLKRDCIFRLKRRPRKYPTAVYSCKLCDSLIDSVPAAHKHIKDRRHKRNLKEKKEEELLNTLPPPTPLQIQAVSCAIDKIVQEHGLDEEDLEKRLATVKAMENLIQNKLPGCSLRLYGSSCSRFGFKNSDLNIDIQFPSSMSQPDVLLLIQESLNQSDQFTDFDADFHARVPVVVCREKKSGLLCKVSAGNENACLTANLLAALGKLEPRLLSLVVAFRHWAKLCCIDRSEEGGLPPYVFSLMVVFFLQQRKEPVLPVYLGTWIKGFSFSKLGQYNLLAVEKDHVLWEQSTTTDGANSNSEETIARGKAPLVFAADRQCSVSVGQLWVDMLRFYALEFNMADLVISIRVKEKTSRDSKDWPKKRIAIEDPFSVKRNVARSLNSQLVYEYILHCLKATYKYFAMPQKKSTIKKPTGSGTVAVSQDIPSQNASNNKTPDTNKMSAINRQLEDLKIDSNINTVDLSQDGQKSHHSPCCKELDIVCSTKKKLVYDTPHPDIVPEDPDCITEEIILCDLEVQSCEELESCNDESEDDVHNLHGRKMPEDYIVIGQGMEEDSESGEALVAGNEENDSLSDLEGFGNPVIIETDSFGLKCSNIVMNKVAMDEESTEGTDELEEPPNEFVSQNFEHTAINNTDDDEEEAVSILLYHRDHLDSLTADDELEHTYIGSMDEGLSEDEDDDDEQPEQVSVDSIKDLEQDKDMSLPVTEHVQNEDSKEDSVLVGNVSEENILLYEFNKPVFTRGKLPMVVCNLCKREGHLKKDCPEDFKKIELDPLPPLTPKFRTILDQVCIQCYEDFSPTVLEDKARESIRQDLEDFIKREFQGARLSLFGSSKNGFGFKQSDLDICMTIDGLETAEELDCIRTIEDLARLLRKHEGLRNILPITTAKVPIVKFYHVRSGLEGDISLYNTLALHNTQLLAAYAAIDPRVKYLCYIMKVFTKICDIGDASRGSLSSYAYTLMVLYFLQQRNPPVIPVLQEIFKDKKKPETLVDGWNVYFFDKLDELANHWSEGYKNKESVGELWLGLLRFYTEDFDFKEHVICIRRKNLLTTFKKQWTSKYIVIEDPFDLNHNLGGGLSRKMTNFIMKAFINGRRVFGTPVKVFPKDYPTKMEYFFDPEVLTEGELAPNDRCCRICGKIGHFMKECPMRRKVRRRNNENAVNQRYPEKRLQRKTEDKEALSKSVENESSGTEGKHTQNTPKKPKQGTKSTNEACRDKTPRPSNEKWRKQEDRDLREKRCFICNREGHLKKECPQYKGSAGSPKSDVLCGSPSAPSPLKRQTRFIQITPQDEKKKQKVFLSPQSGSLSSKYMSQGKPSQKRTQQEY